MRNHAISDQNINGEGIVHTTIISNGNRENTKQLNLLDRKFESEISEFKDRETVEVTNNEQG